MGRSQLGRLSSRRRRQRDERQVWKGGGRIRILKRAGAVVARASRSRRDLRQQERRHDHWIASVPNRRENRQTLGVAFFVWIERVYEDARINCVAQVL